MEGYLKNQLLIRSSRKLVLTDAGRDYVASCRRILGEISGVERIASGEYRVPQGDLVISAPVSFGRTHILPILVNFLSAYPNIKMQLSQIDRSVNLLEENIDLAVRLGALPESSLIATRVGSVRRVLCASPKYLTVRGTPKVPDDLLDHDCIASDATHSRDWWFRKAGEDYAVAISHRLTVTTVESAIDAALANVGIAHLMSYHADRYVARKQLRIVLQEFESPLRPLSLVYPNQRQVPPKLRAFLDFATPRLREVLNYKAEPAAT